MRYRIVQWGEKTKFLSSISIETTTRCNLACRGCYRTNHDYPTKNRHIPPEDFKTYVDQLPFIPTLCVAGLGEPTLHPRITEMIKYARDSKKFDTITFNTNAVAKRPQIYEELFSNGLSQILISVDSLDQEELNEQRFFTPADLLSENIKYLTGKFPDKIWAFMVISKTTLNSFQKTVKKLVALGLALEKIQFCHYSGVWGDPTKCLSFAERKRVGNDMKKLKKPRANNIEPDNSHSNPRAPCKQPYENPMITIDGYLIPCPDSPGRGITIFGNLKQTPFKKLFFSKKYDNLLRGITKGEYPDFCHGCRLNHVETNSNLFSSPEERSIAYCKYSVKTLVRCQHRTGTSRLNGPPSRVYRPETKVTNVRRDR